MFLFSFHVAELVISLSYTDHVTAVKMLPMPFFFVVANFLHVETLQHVFSCV